MNRMRSFARDMVARAFALTGLSSYSRFPSNTLSILTLHRVLPEDLKKEYPLKDLVITPEELHWLLREVQSYFTIDTVTRNVDRLESGEHEGLLMSITLDDGQLDNLVYAVPVFSELGIQATFYIPTGLVGGDSLIWHDQVAFSWKNLDPNSRFRLASDLLDDPHSLADMNAAEFLEYLKSVPPGLRLKIAQNCSEESKFRPDWSRLMNWSEVRGLHESGHEVGSHAVSHGLLTQMTPEQQQFEIFESGQAIDRELGQHPTSFCYPNGSYDRSTLDILSRSNFSNAVTTQWGINHKQSMPFLLGRSNIHSGVITDRLNRPCASRIQMRLSGLAPGLRN